MNASREIRYRVYLTFLGMCVFAILIIYKAISIQVKEGKYLLSLSDSMHTKIEIINPERGNIYTENGELLSTSIPQFDLRIDFKAIPADTFQKYIEPLSKDLAKLLGQNTWTEYKTILTNEFKKENRYFLLKRKAGYEEYLNIKKLQPFVKGKNKGGLIVEPFTKRLNPYILLANRVVGVYRKNGGSVGIEAIYDSVLQGKPGRKMVRRITGGTWIPIEGSEIEPENGADVYTTLDLQIQDAAENALYNQVKKEDATFGTCIVMEVKTGKIKAMANIGKLNDGTFGEADNYALKQIEPGSTFKLVSLISLMRDNLIKIDDKINCQGGTAKFGPFTIRDSHAGLGWLTIKDAFAHSSNVAFAKLIHENYKDRIGSYWTNLHALGLDVPTGLKLNNERNPRIIKDSVTKGRYCLAYMGMGYQVMVTPLHMCMVYNTIANNGKMMKPILVNNVKEYGKDLYTFNPTVVNDKVLDSFSVQKLKEVMNEVVESGTGKALKNPYYSICGKTGTAQVSDVISRINENGEEVKEKIHYKDRMYHGSFIGFFPKENPQYTICVVLRTKKGSNNYYGGQIALPVFKEVANRVFAIKMHDVNTVQKQEQKNIPLYCQKLTEEQLPFITQLLKIKTNAKDSLSNATSQSIAIAKYDNKNNVPDVTGMGLKDAVYMLERLGMRVSCIGIGKVVNQSITPGTTIQKGQKINITLS